MVHSRSGASLGWGPARGGGNLEEEGGRGEKGPKASVVLEAVQRWNIWQFWLDLGP